MKTKLIIIISVLVAVSILAVSIVLLETGDNGTVSENTSSVSPAMSSPDLAEPSEASKDENLDPFVVAVDIIKKNAQNLKCDINTDFSDSYFEKMRDTFGLSAVEGLAYAMKDGVVDDEMFYQATGYSKKAFISMFNEDLERTTICKNTDDGIIDLAFVGDTMFCEGYSVMNKYTSRGKGVEGIVSRGVLDIMHEVDIMMANNEFTLTTRGTPVPNKRFTFRGDPKNVSIYHEMSVDIVGLANNHAFDYQADSLTDTLTTLDGAGIARVGAGENLDEARAPYYYIINGKKIAYVAGSAIDRHSTRGATEKQSGVFQIFDTVSMCKLIEEAKENADYVIAYVHWGVESTTVLTAGQKSMGKAFVDSGADAVIGMHSHCMQGVEMYNGKLIAYSLGNFTFSGYDLTCDMVRVQIDSEGKFNYIIYPMMQKDNFTYIVEGDEFVKQMGDLRNISINALIADDGTITAD